ncbi:MAG: hypothetical protein ABJA76_05955 [Mucilaginibacter sp.]
MKRLIIFLLTVMAGHVYGQPLIISPEINLPKDSATKTQLISALNGFLAQKEKPHAENKFILKGESLATSMLLDELKGMEKNAKLKDDHYYKPYLTNIVDRGDDTFFIQLNYIGGADGVPVLRSACGLMAKKAGGAFYFYSPLKQNTQNWKIKKLGNITFHYKDTLNMADAKAYYKTVSLYDSKLHTITQPIAAYFCDNFTEGLQILGVDYELEYNGLVWDNMSVHENDSLLLVNGWNAYKRRFDPHDLFHERLRQVVNPDIINRPVDEGCAYLYGGSWGISSPEILRLFKEYAAANPNADWLTLYINEKNKNFSEGSKPLKISYAINALVAQKYDKEKGGAPMALLTCGKIEKGDENYFKALEKVSGITKANFNAEVLKLVRNAQ